MQNALTDTGVWYAIFDSRDQYHVEAQDKLELLDLFQLVVPWPTVYETMRTRLVRNPTALALFEQYLKSAKIFYLDDSPYRDSAMQLSLDSSLRRRRPLSMVDCLLRLILDDTNVQISYLATFNDADFSDLCARRGIEII